MILGVDIASVDGNGTVDWAKAKVEGPLSFAYARAAYGTWLDPTYQAYRTAMRAAGVQSGGYLFLRFPHPGEVVADPELQVDAALTAIGRLAGDDLPPAIDLEFEGGRKVTGLSAAEALSWYLRAFDRMKETLGFAPLTYCSYVVWVDPDGMANLPAPELLDTPAWVKYWPFIVNTVAHRDPSVVDGLPAPPCPPPWGTSWAIEQYQGDAIKFPGFAATVDCDRFHVLAQGATGDSVKWAQRRLGGLTVDGVFGPATAAATRAFQKAHGLVVDGAIGPRTFAPLCRANP